MFGPDFERGIGRHPTDDHRAIEKVVVDVVEKVGILSVAQVDEGN